MQTVIPSSNPMPSIDIFPRRVDVKTIADDLHHAGLKYSIQAESIGTGWSTYQRWLAGTEPKYSDMTSLLRLHRALCGEELTLKRLLEAEFVDP